MNISDKTLEEDWLKARTKLPNKRSRYFYKSEIKIPKKSLVIMCGTPGSGKSTLAQKICMQSSAIHIDIDYIFNSLTKELYPNAQYLSAEDIDFIGKDAYDIAYRNAEEVLAKGNTIIWDNLERFPTDRAKVLTRLKDKYSFAILVILKCDKLQDVIRSINRGDTQNRTNLILGTDKYL